MIEITEKMVEDGAQALANDVWHPPVPLKESVKARKLADLDAFLSSC